MSETVGGSGKWRQAGIPHKGWTCVDIEDLDEPSAICEMCEVQEIRYVHYMEHPDYSGQLGVGCVCAGHMEQNYERARQREKVLRNAAGRKRRWLSREWRTSSRGNSYLNTDGYNIVTFLRRRHGKQEIWGFRVSDHETGATLDSRKPYPSEDAAKLRAFDAMIWLKEKNN